MILHRQHVTQIQLLQKSNMQEHVLNEHVLRYIFALSFPIARTNAAGARGGLALAGSFSI